MDTSMSSGTEPNPVGGGMQERLAEQARNADPNNKTWDCDPFLKITIPSLRQTQSTDHINSTRNPDWNQTLTFTGVTGKQEILDMRCIDHDVMSKNDDIGEVFYRLTELGETPPPPPPKGSPRRLRCSTR